MSSFVNIKDVGFKYGDIEILNKINLEIKSGDLLILTGPNGGGKSTLCNIIAGLLKVETGDIDIKKRLKICHAPQKISPPNAIPISVYDFLSYSGGIDDVFEEILQAFEIEKIKDLHINKLSGGQLQRVNLCNSLRKSCDLIILDEPDQNLDFESQKNFYNVLEKIYKQKTFLIISHDIHIFGERFKDAKIFCINKVLHCGSSFDEVHEKHCITHNY